MTPQERQLVDDLYDRLAKLETAPRDGDASAAISAGLRRAPNAVYALTQTVLLQDEALKRAHDRIQQLEGGGASDQRQTGGFLDSMRDALFGSNQQQDARRGSVSQGSVPNVRTQSQATWNSGQVMPQPGAPYGQSQYGAPQSPMGGGGSFLGTAAAAAAGVVGGSLLLGSIRSMMGGSHQGFGDGGMIGNDRSGPWGGDQSSSDLARDAGVNDVGSRGSDRSDQADSNRDGAFQQAWNDDQQGTDAQDDGYDMADDFGGGDSDSA